MNMIKEKEKSGQYILLETLGANTTTHCCEIGNQVMKKPILHKGIHKIDCERSPA